MKDVYMYHYAIYSVSFYNKYTALVHIYMFYRAYNINYILSRNKSEYFIYNNVII